MAGRSRRAWFSVLLGLVVGFTLASRLVLPKATELKKAGQKRTANPAGCGLNGGHRKEYDGVLWPPQDNSLPATEKPGSGSNHFLFVGVMTAQKYLNSRAVAAHRTWAQTVPGRVEFFSSEGSDTSIPIPIVALKNVDDSYPPQKKSFMMLKYMHDHYLDKYEWFMRADDDVYIKSEKLESFLRSLNSSEAIFLGQTGMGARDELGKLALEPGENFCMGGPGVIMSREVLKRMVPHIRECLQEMYTTHEDVEIGRCVRRFAGVQCVWSYEEAQCPHSLGFGTTSQPPGLNAASSATSSGASGASEAAVNHVVTPPIRKLSCPVAMRWSASSTTQALSTPRGSGSASSCLSLISCCLSLVSCCLNSRGPLVRSRHSHPQPRFLSLVPLLSSRNFHLLTWSNPTSDTNCEADR
ncbi:chondroitin sulfate synthase 3 [Gymnodraco acuticeps]|uniref:N-acetylgalactosaminyl-proteoglycan 3-beta-glucuronosyltransferase n=1 Tax=Gymnodraco acuticeps TaxID=8218 RepID=A0A6P8SY97_GYMAC|nr:chondroitin sulfate synthase 3 [Gymnodraco acuticeps]